VPIFGPNIAINSFRNKAAHASTVFSHQWLRCKSLFFFLEKADRWHTYFPNNIRAALYIQRLRQYPLSNTDRIQCGPKKVIHYRESSLNRNKYVNQARFFTNFDYKLNTIILYIRIKYSMYDLICDVISCCVWTCDMGKINVYDNIVMKKERKRKYGNRRYLYINLHLKEDFGMEFTAC